MRHKNWMECTKEELCDAIAELDRDLAAARRELSEMKGFAQLTEAELNLAQENYLRARRECAEMRGRTRYTMPLPQPNDEPVSLEEGMAHMEANQAGWTDRALIREALRHLGYFGESGRGYDWQKGMSG